MEYFVLRVFSIFHATGISATLLIFFALSIGGCFTEFEIKNNNTGPSPEPSTQGQPDSDDNNDTTQAEVEIVTLQTDDYDKPSSESDDGSSVETDENGNEFDSDEGETPVDSDNGNPNDNDSDTGETHDEPDSEEDVVEPPNMSIRYCEEAEEKDLVVLECGDKGIIYSIDFASFGIYDGSCAGQDAAIGECHYAGTAAVIKSACLGKSSCALIADKKEVFDDPCGKDKHFLIVEYTCIYQELCPAGAPKDLPGKCGCYLPDYDGDGDGSADCNDDCNRDPEKYIAGLCGCDAEPKEEEDKDEDGYPKCVDECDDDPNKIEEGICGCRKPDIDIGDSDGDGTINCRDKCPTDPYKTSPGDCGCGRPETLWCLF